MRCFKRKEGKHKFLKLESKICNRDNITGQLQSIYSAYIIFFVINIFRIIYNINYYSYIKNKNTMYIYNTKTSTPFIYKSIEVQSKQLAIYLLRISE